MLKSGLKLLDENNNMLIDRIINTIIEVIYYSDPLSNLHFEDIIGENLKSGSESKLKFFSDVKGISIMQFIILQKIERVKELLLYEDLSVAETAEASVPKQALLNCPIQKVYGAISHLF